MGRMCARSRRQILEEADVGRTTIRFITFVATLAILALSGPASAQLDSTDRKCVTTFSKSVRKVAKTHGKIVKKCLARFAAGSLASQEPEECVADDPKGKLLKTFDKETNKVNGKCAAGFPPFGVSDPATAFTRSVVRGIDLVHGSIGANLDTDLIGLAAGSKCQSKVHASLLKCDDARIKEYLKCQNLNLKNGTIVDAATMASTCTGTGLSQQPDPKGKIASKCITKLGKTILTHCSTTDLQTAFQPCSATDATGLATCLSNKSACELCRVLNDVGGIVRDCDAFDDGDDTNGSCVAECSDGLVHPDESCDDGGLVDGDGCSNLCLVEVGWSCTGEPSVCTQNCGTGTLEFGETCDDGGTASGDGCSDLCAVESGYECSGEPSTCGLICSNGSLDPGESCDDGNAASGDGCSDSCVIEPGYQCAGSPSSCTFVCGNGTFQAGEQCDDNDATGGDGCSALCQIETGWSCAGAPSLCSPVCGDGLLRSIEGCDDGDLNSGDGCDFNCQVEAGFSCASEPSNCTGICGDNFIRGFENCDDGNTSSGDGCSGVLCRAETGYSCTGQPSVCVFDCGDGNLDGIETCDDGNGVGGDGCSATCSTEDGFACVGSPSLCLATCGNSLINPGEECDDGNSVGTDGCSSTCQTEPGWLCTTPGGTCENYFLFIDSPASGVFTAAGSQIITGHYTTLPPGTAQVLVNGVPATTFDPVARTFSHSVALSQAEIFNPVLVELIYLPTGDDLRERIVVIAGNSVADGAFSLQSVALRLNDTGLDSIEPLVGELAAGQFDLAVLLPAGTVITDSCFIDTFLGCLGSARVTIANPPPSFNSLGLTIDSQVNSVFGDVQINGLLIDVNIDGSGLVPDCGLRMTASSMNLTGNYTLEPLAGDPSNLDVNLLGSTGVNFSGFNTTFTSGLCDAPIIGDIIQALLPDVQQLALDGISGFVDDPDGGGPADSPIAQGIEDVLVGISITGPVGAGLGLQLEAPLFAVDEDNSGITLGSDSRFTVSVGGGPGQCIPPAGAPDFAASYSNLQPFPPFGANTPGGDPYGMGICIAPDGFNQLLRGQTECGLMRSSLTEIDLDGPGGAPPLTITSTILSALIPEFGQLPPFTPLRIDIAPTIAPIVTTEDGPGGELTELKIAQIEMNIVEIGPETLWMGGALDASLGMDLAFNGTGTGLAITIGEPDPSDLSITVVQNPLGVDEAQVEAVLPGIVTPLIPDLAGALSGFPLPQFFGLSIDGVDVSKNGDFLSLFANLEAE